MILHHPIFIPSKGRSRLCTTPKLLADDMVAHTVVVEPQDADDYREHLASEWCSILELPENNRGLAYSRSWIKAYSRERGDIRHWQLDDDLKVFRQLTAAAAGRCKRCSPSLALGMTETLVERYSNVAIAGLASPKFLRKRPFELNKQVYSCVLVLNSTPHAWRAGVIEDLDYSLQVLSSGWCTILMNAFLADAIPTEKLPGGTADNLHAGDNRMRAIRSLQARWPGLIKITRGFGLPKYSAGSIWRKFDTPLKPVDPDRMRFAHE